MDGIGLVLAGGGGKGIYQVGILKAFAEAGLLNDVVAISGSSIGSVNGALFAEGKAESNIVDSVKQMEEVWNKIDYNVFFNMNGPQPGIGDSHFSRKATTQLIEEYISYDRFASDPDILPVVCTVAKCPPYVNSTDKVNEEEFKLITSASTEETYRYYTAEYMPLKGRSKADIIRTILATTALPVIYAPVPINGGLYIDGGVKDNVPIKPLYDMGIRKFYVIELSETSAIKGVHSSKASVLTGVPDFPDAEIVDIIPSKDLGKLLSGTMNFDWEDKAFKLHLGELDGKRYIKTLIEKDEAYIAIADQLAELDYNRAVQKKYFDRTYNTLSSNINSRFDYINKIEEQFKGDF